MTNRNGISKWTRSPGVPAAEASTRGARRLRMSRILRLGLFICALNSIGAFPVAAQPDVPVYERDPYDELVLTRKASGKAFRLVPAVPTPRRGDKPLRIHLLNDPAATYEVEWDAIREYRSFLDILRRETDRLVSKRKFDEAFHAMLRMNEEGGQRFVKPLHSKLLMTEAGVAYQQGDFEDAMALLGEALALSPKREDIRKNVEKVAGIVFKELIVAEDYAAARRTITWMTNQFDVAPTEWEQQLKDLAAGEVQKCRAALAAGELDVAESACRSARQIWPDVAGLSQLEVTLDRVYPVLRVGVSRVYDYPGYAFVRDWASARTSSLTRPALSELEYVTRNDRRYSSRFGQLSSDDSREELSLRLRPKGGMGGYDMEKLFRKLGDPQSDLFDPAVDQDFQSIGVQDFSFVNIKLRRPLLRPETVLRFTPGVDERGDSPYGSYQTLQTDRATHRFQLANAESRVSGQPAEIREFFFGDAEDLTSALTRGEVNVVDRVPPSAVARLKSRGSFTVRPYPVPSVHFLLPNYERQLTKERLFRQALLFAIDRQAILRSEILGAANPNLGVILSGPLPIGTFEDDPLGYGYDRTIRPRQREAAVAFTLAEVVYNGIRERQREEQQANNPSPTADEADASEGAEAATPTDQAAGASEEEASKVVRPSVPQPFPPLILAHPADALAKRACTAISEYLKASNIGCQLRELPPGVCRPDDGDWDLLYADIVMTEPLVDLRQLLGSSGFVGNASPYLEQALRQLKQVRVWEDARRVLFEIHRLAHEEVSVLPLWQLTDHFAHDATLTGTREFPVSLYQGVEGWRINRN